MNLCISYRATSGTRHEVYINYLSSWNQTKNSQKKIVIDGLVLKIARTNIVARDFTYKDEYLVMVFRFPQFPKDISQYLCSGSIKASVKILQDTAKNLTHTQALLLLSL